MIELVSTHPFRQGIKKVFFMYFDWANQVASDK